jgi:hypothetical protein
MSTTLKRTFISMNLASWLAIMLFWPATVNAQGAKTLEGTWDVAVTLRNCATGDPIRPPFPRMITFHKGGTLSEFGAAGTEAMPVARAPGHGSWEYLGDGGFSYSVTFLRLTTSGGPDGSISEVRILDVDPSGDDYTADGVAVITFANGTQSPQLCATEVGTKRY